VRNTQRQANPAGLACSSRQEPPGIAVIDLIDAKAVSIAESSAARIAASTSAAGASGNNSTLTRDTQHLSATPRSIPVEHRRKQTHDARIV